jgi:two-component system, cell cycle sensor histidine kinase and response regulator CckA
MRNPSRTDNELLEENALLKQRIRKLEISEAECKQANAGLRESEEKYRTFLIASPDPVFSFTREGRYQYVNRAFAEGVGMAVDDIIGKSIWDVFPKEEADKRFASLSQVFRTGEEKVIEVRVPRADGDRYYITTITPIQDTKGEILSAICTSKDITDRKRAEEALQESEEKYRLVVENAEEAISIAQEGMHKFVNRRALEILGYSKEELTSKPFTEFVHPDDRQMVLERYKKRMKNEDIPNIYTLRIIAKDGTVKWIEIHATLVSWDGKPATLNFFIDITERKLTDEALRVSELRYQAIFETTGTCMLIVEEDMTIFLANHVFESLIGYKREEVEGKRKWTEFVEKDDLEKMISRHQLRRVGSDLVEKNYEFRLVHKDGHIKNILLTVDIIPGTKRSVASLMDITERNQAEERVNYQRRLLRQVIDADTNLIFVKDLEGRYLLANKAMAYVHGTSPDAMIGKTDAEFGATPDEVIKCQKDDLEVVKTGSVKFINEESCKWPSGEIHYYQTTKYPMEDDTGKQTRVLAVGVDITEHKRMEESLNRAQKMESLGRLAGGVAHDLNNILGILTGYSELLLQKLPKDSPLTRYADNILKSSMRGAVIIQDLLTLARRGVTVSEVFNLNKVIFDYLGTPEFEKLKSYHPNVKVRTELEERLLNIKGSPIHMSKTVMNLVSNAAEAISDQGEVTIRTENRYLDRPIRGYDHVQEGDYVVLTISDSGKGISAQDLGKIFEPFYTKKVMGRSGTGLGLAVVWGTVKDHNGYIDVKSEEGKGTIFTLYFNVTREKLTNVQETTSPSSYMGRGESILVVDDRKEQRELAVNMLGWLGYQVEALPGGEEAIEYLKNKKVDLVVLDMIMEPGIDGLETYRRMLQIQPKQKAVIVSGFSETDRVRQAQEIGAGSFVRKPYILENIGLAVKKELDRS